MAIRVQHERAGEPIAYRWGYWHLSVFQQVAFWEINGRQVEMDRFDKPLSQQTAEDKAEFDLYCEAGRDKTVTASDDYEITDPSDGEVVTIKKGDVIHIW